MAGVVKDENSDPNVMSSKGATKPKGQMSLKDMFSKQVKRKAEDEAKGIVKKPKPVTKRCKICRQLEDENFINWYGGHPDGAEEEMGVLFNPSNELIIQSDNYEDRLVVLLDSFDVYCDEGHLVPLNTGLIDTGAQLKFSGILKPLLNPDSDGAAVKDCNILSWWHSGFDGGDQCIIGISTDDADYHLLKPSANYASYMRDVWEEGYLVKYVIEYLSNDNETEEESEDDEEEGVYERFLNFLSQQKPPREEIGELTSETVVKHAESMISQLIGYQEEADEDEKNLLETNLVKKICEISGVHVNQMKKAKNKVMEKKGKKVPKQEKKFVEATVTPLVRNVFENIFCGQLAIEEDGSATGKTRLKACGLCEACQTPDCGECSHCKAMVKFGGEGKSKQKCKLRKCENMTLKEEDIEEVKEEVKEKIKTESSHLATKEKEIDFNWIGEPEKIGKKTFYDEVEVEGCRVKPGDHILLEPEKVEEEPYVGTVVYMFDDKGTPKVHVKWFARSSDTVIGDSGDKGQLFFLDSCDTVPLLSFSGKAQVDIQGPPDQNEWRAQGGLGVETKPSESNDHFTCSLKYDSENGRFEYPTEDWSEISVKGECVKCHLADEKANRFIPKIKERNEADKSIKSVIWDYAELSVGDTVYLTQGSCAKMKARPNKFVKEVSVSKTCDEERYPEKYRKSKYVKGNNFKTPEPFIVARILKFREDGDDMKVKVGLFYRPENLYADCKEQEASIFKLYWSADTDSVPAACIQGRCYIRSCDSESLDSVSSWCEQGPDRWYFDTGYDSGEKKVVSLDKFDGAETFGDKLEKSSSIPQYPNIKKKLACMDIFAGCGGLSQGLHDSGVADTHWAVEIFEPAAKAFEKNNKNSTVFSDDCNLLLKNVMLGHKTNNKNQVYPKRGEVELLCGGPPCQGFSGMNRFNAGEYSKFKNSLIATYLSYAEYYRPKFFILENVKNFACFKKSMVMKCCLQALVRMGYQCGFGILQAGNYGVAQTRRRAILLAAAPGEVLPSYPDPEHVFSPQACHLSVEVDGVRFETQSRWKNGAPRRTTTVWDTMSDLPEIPNGESRDVMKYGNKPKSHFQKNIRKGSKELTDHVTKKMAPLIVKRFEFIPTAPGSDWRDLPNIVVELSDGSKAKKLVYLHNDVTHGKSSTGDKRGVCPCAEGKKCDPKDKQQNTLIPWCLPHTGNRHNHWAGLYGRVEWDGFFSTTVTNPEPMGKQGRVLHPEQNRLVSVRECARSQGFPDTYKFYGSVLEKHRQIGNAVPPPMGRALGQVIGQAMVSKSKGH